MLHTGFWPRFYNEQWGKICFIICLNMFYWAVIFARVQSSYWRDWTVLSVLYRSLWGVPDLPAGGWPATTSLEPSGQAVSSRWRRISNVFITQFFIILFCYRYAFFINVFLYNFFLNRLYYNTFLRHFLYWAFYIEIFF